jgi:hypothetical protein
MLFRQHLRRLRQALRGGRRTRPIRKNSCRPALECLEARLQPATISFSGTALYYTAEVGLHAANRLTISRDPVTDVYTFADAGEPVYVMGNT